MIHNIIKKNSLSFDQSVSGLGSRFHQLEFTVWKIANNNFVRFSNNGKRTLYQILYFIVNIKFYLLVTKQVFYAFSLLNLLETIFISFIFLLNFEIKNQTI